MLESLSHSSELVKQLKRHLRSTGVAIYKERIEHGRYFVLNLDAASHSRRILSVDNQGRAGEYELSYSVQYSMYDPLSEDVPAGKTILIVREYLSDPSDPLGSGAEQALLQKDMEAEAARLIMEGIGSN